MNIKPRPVDRLFSEYIRRRANWTCEACGRICRIGDNQFYKLDASHYHGRRKESVRFDPDNVHALCFTCHQRMGGIGHQEYDAFMLRKLGQARLDALNVRANTPGKKDDAMTKLYIKELMKDLDDE